MLSFKQFDFPPVGQESNRPFNPSHSTQKFWLYTKKNESNNGIALPGLCQTVEYSTQMLAFFGVLLLEIAPTVYGISQGLLWQAVAAAIFIDVILAVIGHWWHKEMILAKNKLVITTNSISQQKIKQSISKYQSYTNLFYFLIFSSGCLKFFFFYSAYIFFDAIALGVLFCYLLGAVLHITYTGYFLYTSRFYWLIWNEYKQYMYEEKYSILDPVIQPINTSGTNIKFDLISVGLHKIYMKDDGIFYLSTFGIMTDTELSNFIKTQQNRIAQDIIAREGLSQQLLIMGELDRGDNNSPTSYNQLHSRTTINSIINTNGQN